MLPGLPWGRQAEKPLWPIQVEQRQEGDNHQDGHTQIHSWQNQPALPFPMPRSRKAPQVFPYTSSTFQNYISWVKWDNHLAGRGSETGMRGTWACIPGRRTARKCPGLTTELQRKIVVERMVCPCAYGRAKMKARGVTLLLSCGPVSAPVIPVDHWLLMSPERAGCHSCNSGVTGRATPSPREAASAPASLTAEEVTPNTVGLIPVCQAANVSSFSPSKESIIALVGVVGKALSAPDVHTKPYAQGAASPAAAHACPWETAGVFQGV